jgi:outer membrane protein OmpA-like peptidoglycan-associated protein
LIDVFHPAIYRKLEARLPTLLYGFYIVADMNPATSALTLAIALLMPFTGFTQRDSVSVYFCSGVAELDDAQTHYLDSIMYAGVIHAGSAINITGYADEPGTTALNNSIAMRRATVVKAYLLSSGIESSQIIGCTGKGNLLHTGKDGSQRRVDILVGALPRLVRASEQPAEAPKPAVASVRKRSLRDLKTMKVGEMMVMENLQFKVSTNVFEPVSLPVLRELAEVLQEFPGVSIRLEGHICCGGKTDSSKKLETGYDLSLSRAQAVLEYLLAHGISSTRLSCAGFGFSRPKIFPERNQEDSYVNRRVEIRVVSNK